MANTYSLRIPGMLMDHVREGSGMCLHPETSGYIPSLGHKLNEAKAQRTGKGYSCVVELTEQEMDEFCEYAEDQLAPARQGEDASLLNAAIKVIDRVEKIRNAKTAEQNRAARERGR